MSNVHRTPEIVRQLNKTDVVAITQYPSSRTVKVHLVKGDKSYDLIMVGVYKSTLHLLPAASEMLYVATTRSSDPNDPLPVTVAMSFSNTALEFRCQSVEVRATQGLLNLN